MQNGLAFLFFTTLFSRYTERANLPFSMAVVNGTGKPRSEGVVGKNYAVLGETGICPQGTNLTSTKPTFIATYLSSFCKDSQVIFNNVNMMLD